jgi:hypothetical protein
MSETYSATYTSTYTEARAVIVMTSALEDFAVLAAARKIDLDKAQKWMEDLLYLAKEKVLQYFELQYNTNGTKIGGYKYTLSDDGSLQENSPSGGIDPYDVPTNCTVSLFASIDWQKKNSNDIKEYLASRGWGINGVSLGGRTVYERAYSKDGYGLMRYKINL